MQLPDIHLKCQGIQTHKNHNISYEIKAENHITENSYIDKFVCTIQVIHVLSKIIYTSTHNDHPDNPVLHIRADRQKNEDRRFTKRPPAKLICNAS